MPKVSPWHSSRESDPKVYHDNTSCEDGDNIEPRYRRAGTDNRRICTRCERYDAQGK